MKNIPILPETGFVRLSTILHFIPMSKSNFWANVKSGIYPAPKKLSERITAWPAEQIHALIAEINQGKFDPSKTDKF